MNELLEKRLQEHYEESLQYFPQDNIFGLFLQGSQNYNLDTPYSDVDTKLLVIPTLHEVALNLQPVSTTHVRANNEHIDFKDIRLMIQTFRKQNINFIECLFTPYFIINHKYIDIYGEMYDKREEIAHYDTCYAVKSMCGQVRQKRKYLCNDSEGRHANIVKYGYDPKELHHIMRFEEFMRRYIAGESFEDCLHTKQVDYLKSVKLGKYSLEEAIKLADKYVDKVEKMADEYLVTHLNKEKNKEVDEFLDYIQEKIIRRAFTAELLNN